ncbi:hypothetical protein D3C80_1967940 [compost metagenome]
MDTSPVKKPANIMMNAIRDKIPLMIPFVFVRANVIKNTDKPITRIAAIDNHIFVIASMNETLPLFHRVI